MKMKESAYFIDKSVRISEKIRIIERKILQKNLRVRTGENVLFLEITVLPESAEPEH